MSSRVPVMMEVTWQGLIRSKLLDITLLYGDYEDVSASLTCVKTAWRDAGGDPPLSYVLGMAERRDSAIARRDWLHRDVPLITLPSGPFREDDIQVTIEGDHRRLRRMSWKHYSVFRFSWRRLRVEVQQRHGDGNVTNLAVVSDLEPYFEGSRRYMGSSRGRGQSG